MTANPYQSPGAEVVAPLGAAAEQLALRETHMRHEVQIRAIGSLYLFVALALVLVPLALAAFGGRSSGTGPPLRLIVPAAIPVAAGLFVLGLGFRRLQPWVRIPGGLLSVLGLFVIPFGTVLNLWILYLMFGPAGRVVLAPGYLDLVAATPQARPRRTLGDRIALGLAVGGLLLIVLIVVLSRLTPIG